jgi:ribosomal protein L7/L12
MHEAAAYALGQIGDARSVEPLIMAIKDRGSHWHNLHEAFIYVFREILPLDPKPLTIALKESREDMDKAADALVKIGMPAIEPLIAALNDSSCCVGEAVVGALDKMGWLPGRDESGANYWVAKGEYWMCIGIGAPAVAPLMARIKERTRHYRYSRKSADALQRRGLHPNPLNDALKGIMNDMDKTADALVKIGKHAIDPLTALLDDRDEYVRILAKGALAIIGKPAVDTPITAGSEAMSTAPLFGEGTDEKATGIAIRLVDSGSMMINVIKVIREVTGVGLQEAKDIVKGTPRIVKDDLSKDEATAIKMKFEEVGAKIEIVDSAEAISSERKNTATTIFGFFTRTEGDALVISISDPEKWKNTLRTRLELNDADVVLFEEKDWLTQELKSKSIDELKKKNSQIISTIEKKLLLQGVPKSVIAEVVKKIEVIPNPISGLVVFVVAYSGDFANYNH